MRQVSNCGHSAPFIYVIDIEIVERLQLSSNVTRVTKLRRIRHTQERREMRVFKENLEAAE